MAHIFSQTDIYVVAWPSGLRRWFKAPVSSEAWVRIPPLPIFYTQKQFILFFKFNLYPFLGFDEPIIHSLEKLSF